MNVSILVPFTPEPGEEGTQRKRNWAWLKKRWAKTMPGIELVVGRDKAKPFSKSFAVNDAYYRSSGDILIVCDADTWVSPSRLATAVEYASRVGVMVIPWSKAHRLAEVDTQAILEMDPGTLEPATTEMQARAEAYRPSPSTAGMVFVVTREGFERAGGMDPRFRGWGAEDVCFGLACDTLLGKKKILLGDAYALHHARARSAGGARVWAGDDGTHNIELAERYWNADGKPREMAVICREHALKGVTTPVEARKEAALRPVDRQYHPPLVPPGVLVREFFVGGTQEGETIRL